MELRRRRPRAGIGFFSVVLEQTVRGQPEHWLALVFGHGLDKQLHQLHVGQDRDVKIHRGPADEVVVFKLGALAGGQVEHHVDLAFFQVVDHVRRGAAFELGQRVGQQLTFHAVLGQIRVRFLSGVQLVLGMRRAGGGGWGERLKVEGEVEG